MSRDRRRSQHFGTPAKPAAILTARSSTTVRPGLATSRGQCFIISSPYARRGELWNLYNRHFGSRRRASSWWPRLIVGRCIDHRRKAWRSVPTNVTRPVLGGVWCAVSLRSGAIRVREAVDACVARDVFERPYQIGQSYQPLCDREVEAAADSRFVFHITCRPHRPSLLIVSGRPSHPLVPDRLSAIQ